MRLKIILILIIFLNDESNLSINLCLLKLSVSIVCICKHSFLRWTEQNSSAGQPLHLPYLIPNTSPITIYGVDRDNNDVRSDRYVCLASLLQRIHVNSARNTLRPGSIFFMIALWGFVCYIFVAFIHFKLSEDLDIWFCLCIYWLCDRGKYAWIWKKVELMQ